MSPAENLVGILSKVQGKKPSIAIPIEDFAVEYSIPIELALCLIGKTKEETQKNMRMLKNFLKRDNKKPGKRPDDKFTSALTNNEIVALIKAYFICDCNASRAEEKLPYTRKTITKYWKMLGLNLWMGAPSKKEEVIIKEIKVVEKDNKDLTDTNTRLVNDLVDASEKINRLEKQKQTENISKNKSDAFLDKINDAKEWIADKIKESINNIHGFAIDIETIKKDIERKKKKIEKLDDSISEHHCFIVDCLEQGMFYLENAEDICSTLVTLNDLFC